MRSPPFALRRGLWSIVKPFLEERTIKKIKVLGASYLEDLLELVPRENLPTFLGGSSECDPMVECGPWQDNCCSGNGAAADDEGSGMPPMSKDGGGAFDAELMVDCCTVADCVQPSATC